MKKVIALVVALVLLAIPVAYALSTITTVNFNVGTVVAFTLTLPGQSAVNANSTGAPTADITFTSSTGTDTDIDPFVGAVNQSDGTPIFQYDNTGTVNLNISVVLNTDVPGCMNFTGATTYAGANNGAVITSTSNTTVVSAYAPAAAAQDWYMKTDFSGCTAVDSTSRTLTSHGVQS